MMRRAKELHLQDWGLPAIVGVVYDDRLFRLLDLVNQLRLFHEAQAALVTVCVPTVYGLGYERWRKDPMATWRISCVYIGGGGISGRYRLPFRPCIDDKVLLEWGQHNDLLATSNPFPVLSGDLHSWLFESTSRSFYTLRRRKPGQQLFTTLACQPWVY